MSIHDEMSDDEVLGAVAGLLSARPVPEPPDARAIMARGRVRRRRWLAGIGLGGTAATTALALGLAGPLAGGPPAALAAGTIRTAAFTIVKSDKGTVTLTLTQAQVLNPDTLQQALARDGIAALVKNDTYCSSHPAPVPSGAIHLQLPDGMPVARSGPAVSAVPPDTVVVIDPAAMPPGTELLFDYFSNGDGLITGLGYIHSLTCVNGFTPKG
jgi:hypothetical protein